MLQEGNGAKGRRWGLLSLADTEIAHQEKVGPSEFRAEVPVTCWRVDKPTAR